MRYIILSLCILLSGVSICEAGYSSSSFSSSRSYSSPSYSRSSYSYSSPTRPATYSVSRPVAAPVSRPVATPAPAPKPAPTVVNKTVVNRTVVQQAAPVVHHDPTPWYMLGFMAMTNHNNQAPVVINNGAAPAQAPTQPAVYPQQQNESGWFGTFVLLLVLGVLIYIGYRIYKRNRNDNA